MPFKPDIYVVEKIGSGKLAVMARPVPGEWIAEEFAGIASFGIGRVVSLLEQDEAIDIGLGEERAYTERNDMEFVHYPIPDRGLPISAEDFARFTSWLYDTIAGGLNTVIHCRAGVGRTGLVAAGVLLHAAFDPEGAFEHIEKARGVSVPDTSEQRDWLVRNHLQILG